MWSTWSDYTICSVTCGTGMKNRTRTCTEPSPLHGGEPCPGVADETKTCTRKDCPGIVAIYKAKELVLQIDQQTEDKFKRFPALEIVDGMWTPWLDGSCSTTCGDGTQTRTRMCSNPAPANGGEDCSGEATEEVDCNPQPCPGIIIHEKILRLFVCIQNSA